MYKMKERDRRDLIKYAWDTRKRDWDWEKRPIMKVAFPVKKDGDRYWSDYVIKFKSNGQVVE